MTKEHDFDLEVEEDPWILGFLRGRKERLEAGLPYIDFDWGGLAKDLKAS